MTDSDSDSDYSPDNYPPESQTGRGPYRISWWAPNPLAGVEIWPERVEDPDLDDPDPDEARESASTSWSGSRGRRRRR